MEFLGFEAYITVDGVKLPHYEVQTDVIARTASCWIPSEVGKSFAIKWRTVKPRPFNMTAYGYVDGMSIGGKSQHGKECKLVFLNDIVTSPTTTRPLLFASIELTDDDAYLKSDGIKDLGDIVLSIWRTELRELETWEGEESSIPLAAVERVHERTKKAMSHQVKFGKEAVHNKEIKFRDTERVSKLATFTFKYRSIDVLRADGIAPPDPKRKRGAGEVDREEEDRLGDDAEEAELKAQLQRIQARLAEKSKTKRIKTESKASSSIVPGEIIDLT